ncbi:MAG: peptidyl-prolyl cis-trans isomerase [Pirellulales bacterium]
MKDRNANVGRHATAMKAVYLWMEIMLYRRNSGWMNHWEIAGWHLALCMVSSSLCQAQFRAPNSNPNSTPIMDRKLDADGVPMAIGNEVFGAQSSLTPAAIPTPVPTQPPSGQPTRFADVRFDAAIPAPQPAAPVANEKSFTAGRLIAIVGEEPVLEGDILPMVDPLLAKNGVPREQWDAYREKLLRPALVEYINNRCLAQKFMHDMVGSKPPKEYIEARKKIDPRIAQSFHEKMIPKLMTDYDASSDVELDQKLREIGTSIGAQRASFRDSIMAQQAIEKNVPRKKDPTLNDLRSYYEDHADQWQKPARAKWRQLTVRFKNHPTKQAAHEKIANLGNEIIFGGVPFEAVARKMSEGYNTSQGGMNDWVNQGSLRSQAIDAQIFSLPLRRLSDIVEDEEGYHILEVLERDPARVVPFEEVQTEIRQKVQDDYKSSALKEFIVKTRTQTHIWTRWPEDIAGSHALSEISP